MARKVFHSLPDGNRWKVESAGKTNQHTELKKRAKKRQSTLATRRKTVEVLAKPCCTNLTVLSVKSGPMEMIRDATRVKQTERAAFIVNERDARRCLAASHQLALRFQSWLE